MGQTVFNGGLDEAELVADIITATREFVGEDALSLVERVDGVGQLDFVTLPWLLVVQNVKDFGGQQVATDDCQVTRGIFNRRLFNKPGNVEQAGCTSAFGSMTP